MIADSLIRLSPFAFASLARIPNRPTADSVRLGGTAHWRRSSGERS